MVHSARVRMRTYGVLLLLTVLLSTSWLSSHAQPSLIPQAWSITPDTTQSFPTDAQFTVTFNQPVTGVDSTDFYTAGDNHTAQISRVERTTDPAVYMVFITRSQPSEELLLLLRDDDSIIGQDATPLGDVGTQNGNAISIAHRDTITKLGSLDTTASRQDALHARAGGIEVGDYNSLALTPSDVPVMSHMDVSNQDLKLTICNNALCSSPTTTLIDSTGVVGRFTSIALSTTNIPYISYRDVTNTDLKLAICNNASTCNSPTLVQVDTAGNVGESTSIALNSTNIPFISYYDTTNGNLKLAICNNSTTCNAPRLVTVDSTGDVGDYTSIELNSAGIPVISYMDSTNKDLKLAICNNASMCDAPSVITVESVGDVGGDTSLALTTDNIPVISYTDVSNEDLKLAICDDATTCANPTIKVIESVSAVGYYSSIALDSNDIAHISYIHDTNIDLKLAICDDATTCANPTTTVIDSAGDVGVHTSIAINSADTPIISYGDDTVGSLKLYHGMQTLDQGQPNTFAKSAPANNSGQSTTTATLSWNSVSNATSYEYCISTSVATCTSWISTGSATSVTLSGLSYATYIWQVRASNAAGKTFANSGTNWRFTIAQLPATFAKTSPAKNARISGTSVTLKWNASTRATSYEYCIALSTSACTNWKSVGTARQVTINNLAGGSDRTYQWQVRAKNAGGTVLATDGFWKFTIAGTGP